MGNQPYSYKASPAVWDHAMSPATSRRGMHSALTPTRQAGMQFTYPGGIDGWVDLNVVYIPRWFTCPQ